METNKHVDLRKLENFARSKYYPGDISKEGKIVHWRSTYKGKRRVIFDSDRKLLIPQYQSILP